MFWTIILIINAVLGVYIFETAWHFTRKHRNVVEERDKLFPAWRRYDVGKWNKMAMYPFAATIMIPRACIYLGSIFFIYLSHKILLIGTDPRKPMPPCKRFISKKINMISGLVMMLAEGTIPVVRHVDVDYSKWLGPDYKKKQNQEKNFKAGACIINHVGLQEAILCFWALGGDCAFVAGEFVEKIPIISDIMCYTEGIFVPREGTAEEKQRVVDALERRHADIEEGRTA